jgi:transcription elongation GreA/GreB family factor
MNAQLSNLKESSAADGIGSVRPRCVLGKLPITVDARRALEAELDGLRAAEATSGDGKRAARMARIAAILDRAVIVDAGPATGHVAMGAIVTVLDESQGDVATYEIDGAFAPLGVRISARSPVGAALLGRRVNDLVTVELPERRTRSLRILAVAAEPSDRATVR